MKVSKAIEILTIHNDHNPDYTDLDRRDAHQLGIEALKRHREDMMLGVWCFPRLLPGETPEEEVKNED